MIRTIQNWLTARAAYAQTYRELSAMSDRDLYDIGIDRGMIPEIAHQSTYGIKEAAPAFNLLETVLEFFKAKTPVTEKDRVYAWLSESSDVVDLERRLKMLDLNQAPWQIAANRNLQGWA